MTAVVVVLLRDGQSRVPELGAAEICGRIALVAADGRRRRRDRRRIDDDQCCQRQAEDEKDVRFIFRNHIW